jgi:hypothetical protein
MKSHLLTAIAGLGILACGTANAANLVTNGGFETTTNGNGQLGFNTTATGWSVPPPSGSYSFVFAPGTADTSRALSQYGGLSLWARGTAQPTGLPASSPNGGNFVAADSAFQQGAISQTITVLIPGQSYVVSFDWAGAQQAGFTGDTFDQLQVTLGGVTHSTPVVNVVNHGFSGWTPETLTFTANNVSDVLSFFATGGPPGVPPFALLDGVSLSASAVPEPTSLALLGVGMAGLGIIVRWRRRSTGGSAKQSEPRLTRGRAKEHPPPGVATAMCRIGFRL